MMRNRRWYIIAICVLAALWLKAEWRSRQATAEMKRVYLNEVAVTVVDAETQEPLAIRYHGPSMKSGEHLPIIWTRLNDKSEARFQWADVKPINIGVSAEGYTEERLRLDRDSSGPIVVSLRRSGGAH